MKKTDIAMVILIAGVAWQSAILSPLISRS